MNDRWNTASLAETHGDSIRATANILTIVLLALVVGQLIFAGVVIFAFDAWNKPATGVLMAGLGVAFAVQMFAMAVFVPAFVQKSGVKRANGDVDQLLGMFRTKTILGGAFVEGGGFLNLVAFMLEHNKWSLAPFAAGVIFLLALIPSQARISHWIEETLRSPQAE